MGIFDYQSGKNQGILFHLFSMNPDCTKHNLPRQEVLLSIFVYKVMALAELAN